MKKSQIASLSLTLLVLGCGSADFGGKTITAADAQSAKKNDDTADTIEIGLSYEEEGTEGLSLVARALTGFKAKLIGGDECFGGQASPATGVVKLRKDAKGCALVYTELVFNDGQTITMKNAEGLSTDDKDAKIFVTDDKATSLKIGVRQTFSARADSNVVLFGQLLKVVTIPVASTSEELSISTLGDVVAYPNVRITNGPLSFMGKIDVTLGCVAVGKPSACKPSLAPSGTGTAEPQPLSSMEAAILVLKGAPATGFPGSINQISLDSAFASGNKIDGVSQALSNVAAPLVSGDSVEFKNLTIPQIAVGDRPLLVVRYFETYEGVKYTTYKAFLLEI